jgi:hypothetical protein
MTDEAMVHPSTVAAAIARAIGAYDDLATLGEDVEDEWTYVTELSASWRDRLDEVAHARADEPVPAEVAAAIDRAVVEIGLIRDPHRAIDWLSTFPQVVLLALAEDP